MILEWFAMNRNNGDNMESILAVADDSMCNFRNAVNGGVASKHSVAQPSFLQSTVAASLR
jgi:hypothetical protein